VNIVSLITCKVNGLSDVGVTKAGRLDDPSDFSPLRYGFGPRFVEAVRRYGPFEFTIKILGHGYANRAELYSAQRRFIEEYNTLWPHGYNVFKGRESHSELPSAAITAQRLARDPQWRAANAAAAAKRAQSTGWRLALNKRAQNATWRRPESIARTPILHARWHVKRGLVPLETTAENCDLCKAVAQRKTYDEPTELPEILEPLPPYRMEDALADIVERVNRMFGRN
jgi:hypothetical protein